jgi:hypothetical protein
VIACAARAGLGISSPRGGCTDALPFLGAAHVERGGAAEFDLAPFQIGDLTGAQAMPVAEQDQRRVTMPIAAAACCADEPFDLGRREVLAGAQRAVGRSLRSD